MMFAGREQHFENFEAFLRYLEDTKAVNHGGAAVALTSANLRQHGPALEVFIEHCRTMGGEFPELLARVHRLLAEVTLELPPMASVTRRRCWGKTGASVNPHRVLRGQLATAWRRTTREHTLSLSGPVHVVVPTIYAGSYSQNTIAWMAAVSLALAQAIDASGRRCELWGFALSTDHTWTREPKDLFRSLVRLKAAEEPWSEHGPVYPLHRAFARRLVFRLIETLGPATKGYGWAGYYQAEFDRYATDALETFAGVPASSVICGPWPESTPIDSKDDALAWLSSTLATLNAVQVGKE